MSEENEPVEVQDEQTPEETEEVAEDAAAVEVEAAADPEAAQADESAAVPEPAVAPAEPAKPVHALSKPPVIDLSALLKPISADVPSGESLRYEGIYDEIGEERRADEDLAQGVWKEDLKIANFKRVIELATAALSEKTKDLQLAAWLGEALVAEHGFSGLRDSLKMMRGLLANFWESIYPEVDEGDEEGRANALAWFDEKAGFLIRQAQILDAEGCSYNGFVDSKRFDIPDNLDSLDAEEKQKMLELRALAERESRITAAKWTQALTLTKRAFCEELAVAIAECADELKELNLEIENKFNRNQVPGLRGMGKAMADIDSTAKKILEQKRVEEPDPSDVAEVTDGDGEASADKGGSASGAVNSRDDALRKLSEIAAFFKRTEPHSPVAYLVNRAVNWGNMPLENWLQDVIKDENILFQLRQTLGFNTGPSGESQTEGE